VAQRRQIAFGGITRAAADQQCGVNRPNPAAMGSRETAVLAFGCTKLRQALCQAWRQASYQISCRVSQRAVPIGAAFVISIASSVAIGTAAHAQTIDSSSCLESWNSFNCVNEWAPIGDPFIRIVPAPADAAAQASARHHERRWADRCRPVIRQDRYGIARYRYAAPGCEFGIGQY
jgi:hypothetical protein